MHRGVVIDLLIEVEGLVQVHMFHASAAFCKCLPGDIAFDKGVHAIGIARVANVDDHAEAI